MMGDEIREYRKNEPTPAAVKAEMILKMASSEVAGQHRKAHLELAATYFREAQMIDQAHSIERWIALEYPQSEEPPPLTGPDIEILKISPIQ